MLFLKPRGTSRLTVFFLIFISERLYRRYGFIITENQIPAQNHYGNDRMRDNKAGYQNALFSAFSNRVYRLTNVRSTLPIGPFLCFPMITSAFPLWPHRHSPS